MQELIWKIHHHDSLLENQVPRISLQLGGIVGYLSALNHWDANPNPQTLT